jgi:hypothetical protein
MTASVNNISAACLAIKIQCDEIFFLKKKKPCPSSTDMPCLKKPNRTLEAVIDSLHTIANIELLIRSTRDQFSPSLIVSVDEHIDEYTRYSQRLVAYYVKLQPEQVSYSSSTGENFSGNPDYREGSERKPEKWLIDILQNQYPAINKSQQMIALWEKVKLEGQLNYQLKKGTYGPEENTLKIPTILARTPSKGVPGASRSLTGESNVKDRSVLNNSTNSDLASCNPSRITAYYRGSQITDALKTKRALLALIPIIAFLGTVFAASKFAPGLIRRFYPDFLPPSDPES